MSDAEMDSYWVDKIAAFIVIGVRADNLFTTGFLLGQAKWMTREIRDKPTSLRAGMLVHAAYAYHLGFPMVFE